MDNIIGNNGEVQFANGQSSRDLRASSGYRQRLPVRIMFAPRQDPNHLLHPGMSVERRYGFSSTRADSGRFLT